MPMKPVRLTPALFVASTLLAGASFACGFDKDRKYHKKRLHHHHYPIQLGPRPYYLVKNMPNSELKDKLLSCVKGPFKKSDFSIGHRGAPLQFPEHTQESYVAAARMGAGLLECDVTFTKDRELVCRHAQCDLHTSTNILTTPLAEKCSKPFVPAHYDEDGNWVSASAKCCTSDITLAEFKTLQGKINTANQNAATVEEYLDGTASWQTDFYSGDGSLMSHAESIELFKSLGVKMTPELKRPSVEMPYEGDYTQEMYAQQLIDEYKAARVKPERVFPQSFNLEDILYWIKHERRFGKQAVYLDNNFDAPEKTIAIMSKLADMGVNYLAPPVWMLVTLENGEIVPSVYALSAKANDLKLFTWTLERSGSLQNGGGWYYQSIADAIDSDGMTMVLIDVLAQEAGVEGIFSDWPATTTYYANCMDL